MDIINELKCERLHECFDSENLQQEAPLIVYMISVERKDIEGKGTEVVQNQNKGRGDMDRGRERQGVQ